MSYIRKIGFEECPLPAGVIRYTIDRSVLREQVVVTLYWDGFEGSSGTGVTVADAVAKADACRPSRAPKS